MVTGQATAALCGPWSLAPCSQPAPIIEAFAHLETTSEPVDGWYGYMAERYFSTSTIPASFQTHG